MTRGPTDWEDKADEDSGDEEEVGEAADDPAPPAVSGSSTRPGPARRSPRSASSGNPDRRRPDPHSPPQPGRPVHRRDFRDRGFQGPAPAAAARLGRDRQADGPVTVETYQWFRPQREAGFGRLLGIICDEAPPPRSAKTSACIRSMPGPVCIGMTATGALIARHVADLFPTQTSRFDLAGPPAGA